MDGYKATCTQDTSKCSVEKTGVNQEKATIAWTYKPYYEVRPLLHEIIIADSSAKLMKKQSSTEEKSKTIEKSSLPSQSNNEKVHTTENSVKHEPVSNKLTPGKRETAACAEKSDEEINSDQWSSDASIYCYYGTDTVSCDDETCNCHQPWTDGSEETTDDDKSGSAERSVRGDRRFCEVQVVSEKETKNGKDKKKQTDSEESSMEKTGADEGKTTNIEKYSSEKQSLKKDEKNSTVTDMVSTEKWNNAVEKAAYAIISSAKRRVEQESMKVNEKEPIVNKKVNEVKSSHTDKLDPSSQNSEEKKATTYTEKTESTSSEKRAPPSTERKACTSNDGGASTPSETKAVTPSEKETSTPSTKNASTSCENITSTSMEKHASTSNERKASTPSKKKASTSKEEKTSTSSNKCESTPSDKKLSTSSEKRSSKSSKKKESVSSEENESIASEKKSSKSSKKKESVSKEEKESTSSKRRSSKSSKKKESVSSEENESIASEKKSSKSSKKKESVSKEEKESTSIKRRSSKSSKIKESVSSEENESIASEKKSSKSSKKEESVLKEEKEFTSSKRMSSKSSKIKESVSSEENESIASEKKESVSKEEEESTSSKRRSSKSSKIKESVSSEENESSSNENESSTSSMEESSHAGPSGDLPSVKPRPPCHDGKPGKFCSELMAINKSQVWLDEKDVSFRVMLPMYQKLHETLLEGFIRTAQCAELRNTQANEFNRLIDALRENVETFMIKPLNNFTLEYAIKIQGCHDRKDKATIVAETAAAKSSQSYVLPPINCKNIKGRQNDVTLELSTTNPNNACLVDLLQEAMSDEPTPPQMNSDDKHSEYAIKIQGCHDRKDKATIVAETAAAKCSQSYVLPPINCKNIKGRQNDVTLELSTTNPNNACLVDLLQEAMSDEPTPPQMNSDDNRFEII